MAWPKIPSLINTDIVDIYVGVIGQGSAGSYQPTYPSSPTMQSVPCSVQFSGIAEIVDEQGRVTQLNSYSIMIPANPGVRVRDKIVWTDKGGVTHTAFVQSSVEITGEGNTWEVPVIERI